MSFVAIALPIVTTVAGAVISDRSSSRSTDLAVAGEQANIDFQRESRDQAREDSAPWREAGGTALNALMDMTGLQPNQSVRAEQWNDKYTDPSRPTRGTQADVFGIPEGANAGNRKCIGITCAARCISKSQMHQRSNFFPIHHGCNWIS